jgi:uncharacterized PurR-regulated membrane protein YhhQ (DUF165 family)
VNTIIGKIYERIIARRLWSAAYISTVAAINWLFISVPPLVLFGTQLPPAILLAGAVHVLRDFSQREIGNRILIAMAVASAISFYTASPAIAAASAFAFMISEFADWIVFTITRRKLSQRILISSAVGVPIDTALFLAAVGLSSWRSLLLGILAKMLSAVLFWAFLRWREE